jgi:hypothetical protein
MSLQNLQLGISLCHSAVVPSTRNCIVAGQILRRAYYRCDRRTDRCPLTCCQHSAHTTGEIIV